MRYLIFGFALAFALSAGEAAAQQGAAFDVSIEGSNVATTVEKGTVVLCPRDASPDECVELSDWCSYAVMSPGKVDAVGRFPLQEDEEKEDFALLDTDYERTLRREFQSQGISCGSELAVILTLIGIRAENTDDPIGGDFFAGAGSEGSAE